MEVPIRTICVCRMVDALIEDKPGMHPVPPMPATDRPPGRYLNRETGATVDLAIDKIRPSHREHARRDVSPRSPPPRTAPCHQPRFQRLHHATDLPKTRWNWSAMRACAKHCIVFPATPRCRPTCQVATSIRTSRRPGPLNTNESGMTAHVAGPMRTAGPWGSNRSRAIASGSSRQAPVSCMAGWPRPARHRRQNHRPACGRQPRPQPAVRLKEPTR